MKPIRLCLLGLDGTGKTSLAKHIQYMTGWTYYKDSLYKESYFGSVDYTEHSAAGLLQYLAASNEHAIFDRFFWDEIVYGPVLHRRTMNDKTFTFLDSYAYQLGFRLIYLYKDKPPARPDDKITIDMRPELVKGYEKLLKYTSCPIIRINSTDEDVFKQFSFIRKWLV